MFESMLQRGDPEFLAECRKLANVAADLAKAMPAVPPPNTVREQLLKRATGSLKQAATSPQIPSDSPELERAGIFIRRQSDLDWQDHRIPGVRVRFLYVDHERKTQTLLMRCAPGAKFPSHDHQGVEESLVLEGDLHIGDVVLRVGDYQRCAAGSRHPAQSTENGCLLLVTAPLN